MSFTGLSISKIENDYYENWVSISAEYSNLWYDVLRLMLETKLFKLADNSSPLNLWF